MDCRIKSGNDTQCVRAHPLERDEMRLVPREMGRIFLTPGCTYPDY